MPLRVDMAAGQTCGGRPQQEDTYWQDMMGSWSVMIVADGMGGVAHGKEASDLAVRVLVSQLFRKTRVTGVKLQRVLKEVVQEASRQVRAQAQCYGDDVVIGTTLTVAILVPGKRFRPAQLVWAHVGDSRLYCIRDGQISQITQDEDLQSQPRRMRLKFHTLPGSALMQFVGQRDDLVVQSGIIDVQQSDVYILDTDGLRQSCVHDHDVLARLGLVDGCTARDLLADLLRGAGSHHDNTTVVVGVVQEV